MSSIHMQSKCFKYLLVILNDREYLCISLIFYMIWELYAMNLCDRFWHEMSWISDLKCVANFFLSCEHCLFYQHIPSIHAILSLRHASSIHVQLVVWDKRNIDSLSCFWNWWSRTSSYLVCISLWKHLG